MPRLLRFTAAAFLMDMALYLTMTGVPYKALALGAGPLILGFLPAARALPYGMLTIWAGGRSEEADRFRNLRWVALPAVLSVAALAVAGHNAAVVGLLGILGVGLAFFWPALQASCAELPRSRGVTGNLGWFNLAWSTGKGVGFLAGGWVLSRFGFGVVFVASAVAMGIALLLVLRRSSVPVASPAQAASTPTPPPVNAPAETHRDHPRLPAFRRAAWLGNAFAFGVGAVLNHHYPNWLEATGRSETLFGTYLGLIFLAQTAGFLLMLRFDGWRYRSAPLVLTPLPMLAVLLLLPKLESPDMVLATAPVIGFALGFAYYSSIFYSVAGPRARGRFAGIHETMLAFGSLLLPVIGGAAASILTDLTMPYVVTAILGLVVVGLQAYWLLRPGAPVEQGSPVRGMTIEG